MRCFFTLNPVLVAFGKQAGFWQDYAYHANQLYNPESYGLDVRAPTGRDDIRNMAVATAVGTGLGAIRGAIWPGYIEQFDNAGKLISKKRRGRLSGSLRDALATGTTSAISSAAGITAKKYLPEIEAALNKVKTQVIQNLVPVRGHVRFPPSDNPALLDKIKHLA